MNMAGFCSAQELVDSFYIFFVCSKDSFGNDEKKKSKPRENKKKNKKEKKKKN